MAFEILDSISLPGDAAKPNEDEVAAESHAAMVFDGATPLNPPLMPGRSDAAWIASFGARRLMAHLKDGATPRAALRHALADAERSFAGLRRRAPQARHEWPLASMMLAVPRDGGVDLLWYGDCAALMQRPGEVGAPAGPAADKRAGEAAAARQFCEQTGLAPVEALKRPEHLDLFRGGRAKTNVPGGSWLFGAVAEASEHVAHTRLAAAPGTLLLLATDGFFAAVEYGLYQSGTLIDAALDEGLAAIAAAIRAIEDDDPEGRKFARFKRSDDASAVLVKLV